MGDAVVVVLVLNLSGEFEDATAASDDVATARTVVLEVMDVFAGLVIPESVIVTVVPAVMSQLVGNVTFTDLPDVTVTAPAANAVPSVQPVPLKPAVGVTVDVVKTNVPVADSSVAVMVLFEPLPVSEVAGSKLTVHVDDAEAVLEPGVMTTAVKVPAEAGAVKSVRPPKVKAAQSAVFTHT
jgi:hypothetical protein